MSFIKFILLGLSWGSYFFVSDYLYSAFFILTYLAINQISTELNVNRTLKKIRILSIFLIPVFIYPMLIGNKDLSIAGIGYSGQELDFSMSIILRAVLVFVTFTFISGIKFDLKGSITNKFERIRSYNDVLHETNKLLPQINNEINEFNEMKKNKDKKSIYSYISERLANMILSIYKEK